MQCPPGYGTLGSNEEPHVARRGIYSQEGRLDQAAHSLLLVQEVVPCAPGPVAHCAVVPVSERSERGVVWRLAQWIEESHQGPPCLWRLFSRLLSHISGGLSPLASRYERTIPVLERGLANRVIVKEI